MPGSIIPFTAFIRKLWKRLHRFPHMPLAAVGKVSIEKADFSLQDAKESGEAPQHLIKKQMKAMKPSRLHPQDMGDSMAKAFQKYGCTVGRVGT